MGSFCLSNSGSFFSLVQKDIHSVETRMQSQADGYHHDIGAALQLLLSAGGKRLRPTITLLIGQMLNAPIDRLITLASAIELLHTATLVHDDLIDGSLLRRGMPTLNSQWSPGATVLAGDFLFSCAAKLAAETESIPVIKLFAHTLTVIVNGEVTQLLSGHNCITREMYYQRIYAKTASLIETAARSAALIAPTSEATVENMRSFGYEIGMGFQIVDDILDFTGEEATLGKPVGSDLRQGLFTLPTIIFNELYPENPAIQILIDGSRSLSDEQVVQLVNDIRQSNAIKLSFNEANQFVDRGLSSLLTQPKIKERQALEELAKFIIERKI
jgi:geranylgeranyl pyrophosphate synthase